MSEIKTEWTADDAKELMNSHKALKMPYNLKHHTLWKQAFDYYNQNNSQKLGMGCAPCYIKVGMWINKQIIKIQSNG
jgi:hypothetical protein